MKHVTFIVFALAFLLSLSAFARIGETLAQCEARYGKAVETGTDGTASFVKGGFRISAVAFDGKVAVIKYCGTDNGGEANKAQAITDEEINALLKANGGEKTWVTVSQSVIIANFKKESTKTWKTQDGALGAISKPDCLIVFLDSKESLELLQKHFGIDLRKPATTRSIEGL